MTRPILYTMDVSSPGRSVLLTAEAIGLDVEVREINLFTKEQLNDDFIKLNPQHTLPTLVVDNHVFWDSHAIMCYLVGKYAKNDNLYPKNLEQRAVIDQRLYFENGILYPLFRFMARWIFYHGNTSVPEDKMILLKEAFEFMDKFLEGKKWLAGDNYTLADISCVTTMSSLDIFLPISNYPNVDRWYKNCQKQLPGYEQLNEVGNKKITDNFKSKMQ